METPIAWCGFLGAWLLVAGPIYQAAVELQDEGVEREAMSRTLDAVPAPRPLAFWWWLIPPVAYWLHRSRSRKYRDAVLEAMTPDQVSTMISFSEKASGWFYVAAGAFFIAVKETWELAEHHEWPHWVFAGLIVLGVVASAGNTAARMRRSHDILVAKRAERA